MPLLGFGTSSPAVHGKSSPGAAAGSVFVGMTKMCMLLEKHVY